MKIFLDDERKPPEGYVLVRWPNEVIKKKKKENVSVLSLDHDLGDDKRGTGYDVLLKKKKEVYLNNFTPPELIKVHSVNVSARIKMEQAIIKINKNK